MRAIAINTMKVGSLLEETDPVRAIDQYHQSLAAWDRLPPVEQARPISQRIIANDNRKLGLALTNVRDYVAAIAAFEKARSIQHNSAQADPKDARAQYDLAIDLSSEAMTYVDMLDPRLHADRSNDLQARRQAIALLKECRAIMGRLLLVDPSNKTWAIFHAHNGFMLGVLERDVSFTTDRLAELRKSASVANPPVNAMDLATSAMLIAEPTRLRDPAWTVACAEKLNEQVHRRKVEFLLTLAQAYRAAGNSSAAKATARDALAMLPPVRTGEPLSRVRVLLSLQTE
jgi:tetratricopeptide (TPR) repeat protein